MTGRDPSGQALAVPATPANAVDGPSGFDPSRDAPLLLSRLREPPVVGRRYMVPCVEYTYLGRRDVWPVIGPRHEDAEYIGFSKIHYHIDPRFLTGDQARFIRRNGRGSSVKESAATYVLARHGDPDVQIATLQPRRCRIKTWVYSPPLRPAWLKDFDKVFGKVAEPIRTADGRLLCPHKKTDLSQFVPDEDGIVTCPLHGLRVRCTAIATEARRAETPKSDSVHEGAGRNAALPETKAVNPYALGGGK